MLLFFDVDGTLIDDFHQLVPSVKPAMESAKKNGHLLIINTGRTLCNLDSRLDGLPIDGWIMGCGTRIIYHGETLQSMEYDPEKSLRLRDVFRELNIATVYECDTGMYFDPAYSSHPMVEKFHRYAEQHGIAREIDPDDPEFRAVKMFCFAEGKSLISGIEKKTAEIGLPYVSIDRSPIGWEIVPAGYTKGTGIHAVREKLGFDISDCFAFGDSRNDMTMLQSVAHSVAMGNAPDDVKAVCSYVTDRPENDGIRKAFEHFGLI
uniref:HAD-superfamily hydrolase, subfamily IIB n=1 Tax=uncultured bacterium Contigcl_23 TaxID=1393667 RepID=W0FL31_9BACT|nr:HAD-superfamily hydrolase, subfamily IIB [uncultured bacterium Contigcl_23]